MKRSQKKSNATARGGTTMVETAVVLPIFFLILFGFVEFGHCFMTIHTMNAAARQAARAGVADGGTTTDVVALAHSILDQAINADHQNVQIWVKDASAFDDPAVDAATINYEDLPDVELADVESRSLFLVRIQVPYSDIGILGPRWVQSVNLYGQSVMRKE